VYLSRSKTEVLHCLYSLEFLIKEVSGVVPPFQLLLFSFAKVPSLFNVSDLFATASGLCIGLFFVVWMYVMTTNTYALDCAIGEEAPESLDPLLCVAISVINIVYLASGMVFVLMLLLTAFKFVMTQGDPKGMAAAKQTGIYAFLGFLIVVGMHTFYSIITSALGVTGPYATTAGVFEGVGDSWTALQELASPRADPTSY